MSQFNLFNGNPHFLNDGFLNKNIIPLKKKTFISISCWMLLQLRCQVSCTVLQTSLRQVNLTPFSGLQGKTATFSLVQTSTSSSSSSLFSKLYCCCRLTHGVSPMYLDMSISYNGKMNEAYMHTLVQFLFHKCSFQPRSM